jgi:hypothetical protein
MFHILLQGEDRTEFTIQVDNASQDQARLEAEDRYPEARVLEVWDPHQRALDSYRRAERMYDDPSYDDFDY